MIRIATVYDEINKDNDWIENKDSKERIYRKKFNFLMLDVMLRNPENYKKNGVNEVSIQEATVIKNLIVESLKRNSVICKWFNNSLDLSVSENVIQLFLKAQDVINAVYIAGLTDKVTKDEWLAAIDAATDYSNAIKIVEIKQRLEELRASAKPLNHRIGFGDIINEYDDGSREYLHRGKRDGVQLTEETTIKVLMDNLSVENQYHDVLIALILQFKDHATSKALEDIQFYAEMKTLNDDDDTGGNVARDYVGDSPDYLHRFRSIYDYLKVNPEVVTKIENEVRTTGLLEFFNVSIKGEKK